MFLLTNSIFYPHLPPVYPLIVLHPSVLLLPDCFLNNSSFPSVPSIYQASPCSLAPRKIFTMGWGLMRWIVSVRSVQLMGTFIPGALNGWLLYYIYSKEIGLVQLMVILQVLVCCLHGSLSPLFDLSSLPSGNKPQVVVSEPQTE